MGDSNLERYCGTFTCIMAPKSNSNDEKDFLL